MRIIFIAPKLNFKSSGGSIVDLDLKIRELINKGHAVTLVTLFSLFNDFSPRIPYPVIEERSSAKGQLEIQLAIFKALKKYAPAADVMHIDGHIFLYGAGLYRRMGGAVPVVAFFNRELTCWPDNMSALLSTGALSFLAGAKKKIRWYLEKYLGMWLANGIDMFTFTNPALQKTYEDFGLRPGHNPLIMGDLIDIPGLMRGYGLTAATYLNRNKDSGKITIFFSGRMVAGKGFDTLIQAFSYLKNKENYQLILGGDGPERALLEKLADQLGVRRYVIFPGWVSKDRVFDFFKQTDIFVLPRFRKEIIAVTLVEALVFGLPCIVPAGGALEWRAGGAALSYEDGDYKDLAKKIEQLGADKGLRAELSRKAYAHVTGDALNYKKIASALAERMIALVKRPQTEKA